MTKNEEPDVFDQMGLAGPLESWCRTIAPLYDSPLNVGLAQVDKLFREAKSSKVAARQLIELATHATRALGLLYFSDSGSHAPLRQAAADFTEFPVIRSKVKGLNGLSEDMLRDLPLGENSPFKWEDWQRGRPMKIDWLHRIIIDVYGVLEGIRTGSIKMKPSGSKLEERAKRLTPLNRGTCTDWADMIEGLMAHAAGADYIDNPAGKAFGMANSKRAINRNKEKRMKRLEERYRFGAEKPFPKFRDVHLASLKLKADEKREKIKRETKTRADLRKLLKEAIKARLKTMVKLPPPESLKPLSYPLAARPKQ